MIIIKVKAKEYFLKEVICINWISWNVLTAINLIQNIVQENAEFLSAF